MKAKVQLLALITTLFSVASCSKELGSIDQNNNSSTGNDVISNENLVELNVTLSEDKLSSASLVGNSFNLVSATAFSISMEGCASGYASTANEVSSSLKAYKFDRDCLAKLTSFQVNGITYIPSIDDPFTTWLVGDTATFEDQTDSTVKISVKITSTLDNPISGTENVSYAFSEINAGSDSNIADNIVGDAHAMAVDGQEAPSFFVNSVHFTGITSTGAGQFEFTLECSDGLTGTGADTACRDVKLQDVRYKLVADVYAGSLSITEAQGLFPTGESAVLVPDDVLDPGVGSTVNGGFITKTGIETLTGPDQMHNNPNMILILEASDTSYQYFNVDVTTLTQD